MNLKGKKGLEGRENKWAFSHGFNMMVDFCIYVLEVDGLHVPPFDLHLEGNRTLRTRGCTADDWRFWLAEVVALQDRHITTAHQKQTEVPPSLAGPRYNPPSVWVGPSAVRDYLTELWEMYGPVSNERREWEMRLAMKWAQELPNLWYDLKPYQTQLATLTIHLISYPKAVDYLVPPTSGIIAIVDGQLDSLTFRNRVLRVAESLAANSDNRT